MVVSRNPVGKNRCIPGTGSDKNVIIEEVKRKPTMHQSSHPARYTLPPVTDIDEDGEEADPQSKKNESIWAKNEVVDRRRCDVHTTTSLVQSEKLAKRSLAAELLAGSSQATFVGDQFLSWRI